MVNICSFVKKIKTFQRSFFGLWAENLLSLNKFLISNSSYTFISSGLQVPLSAVLGIQKEEELHLIPHLHAQLLREHQVQEQISQSGQREQLVQPAQH